MNSGIYVFQNIVRGSVKIACFSYGQLPSIDVDIYMMGAPASRHLDTYSNLNHHLLMHIK